MSVTQSCAGALRMIPMVHRRASVLLFHNITETVTLLVLVLPPEYHSPTQLILKAWWLQLGWSSSLLLFIQSWFFIPVSWATGFQSVLSSPWLDEVLSRGVWVMKELWGNEMASSLFFLTLLLTALGSLQDFHALGWKSVSPHSFLSLLTSHSGILCFFPVLVLHLA